MAKLNLKKYGKVFPISLEITEYEDNGNLAIAMYSWDNGYPEPWGILTINLDKRSSDCAFIDTNDNGEEIIGWIVSNGLGELTGEMGYSGFCCYPEVRFNLNKVREVQ